MTEKGLERLTAICRQLEVRRGRSWLIFQEWKGRELALIHFLISAGFLDQKAQMGEEKKKKRLAWWALGTASFHPPESCGYQQTYKRPSCYGITHNSPARCISIIQSLWLPFLVLTLRRQTTPTHLLRFPSLVFGVLCINEFWVLSGQQNEGIPFGACPAQEMPPIIAKAFHPTQLPKYGTQDTASFSG